MTLPSALPKGDCYEAAFKSCEELKFLKTVKNHPNLQGKNIHIVHGWVTPPTGPYAGKRLKHAWVQCGEMVYETSNNQTIDTTIRHHTDTFQAVEAARYSIDQARAQLERTGCYGFWSELPSQDSANN